MPIQVACPVCGADYKLKDEFAGRKVRCPGCQNTIQVPDPMPVAEFADPEPEYDDDPAHQDDIDPAFDRDKFLLRQKLWSIKEKYTVADEDGDPVVYVERPVHLMAGCLAMVVGIVVMAVVGGVGAFVGSMIPGDLGTIAAIVLGIGGFLVGLTVIVAMYPKRHINFYADKKMKDRLLEVRQDKKVVLINATFTLVDADGEVLAKFHKNHLYNILRKRWYVYRPDGDLWFVAKEDSIILSLLRRLVGMIPETIPFLGLVLAAALRTNFVFLRPGDDEHLGMFNRRLTLLDRYVLDLNDDPDRYIDRRVAVAMGVLLDTGERR